MDFRVLGPISAAHDGHPVHLGPSRQRKLLAMLLVHANETVSTQRLIDELFDDLLPKKPGTALQIHVSRLRKALTVPGLDGKGIVSTQPPGYAVNLLPNALDAWRFERLLAQGRAAMAENHPVLASETLAAALELWHGPALGEFTCELFAQPEVTRLEELRLTAMEELFEARLTMGHHHALVGEIEALIRHQPLRERLSGQLMVCLYRCGRQADALRAYERLRVVLGEEIGIDPSPELQALNKAVLLQEMEGDWNALKVGQGAAPMAQEPPRWSGDNLPTSLTRFIGRRTTIAELLEQVADSRLLTLTGPGGSGKTRLALQVASEAERPAHGAWLVDLSSLTEPSLVARAVASVLGIYEEGGETVLATLARALRHSDMLIVLDNCEHVLGGSAECVTALLPHCPRLRFLATSRSPLGVIGEVIWPVPPLSVPEEPDVVESVRSSEAAELFADRAGLVHRGFRLTPDNAAFVATICLRLDGIPLAIELAAARVRNLSLAEIADRLDDRFGLLVQGGGSAPARQQTLLRTLDWSHELLSSQERALLRRMSVFRGGTTLAGAERVCAGGDIEHEDVCDIVSRLVDKSVVNADVSSTSTRYRLLESVREYAAARLFQSGETTWIRDRHAAWCIDLAAQAEDRFTGLDQHVWIERVQIELDNLRAALEWTISYGDEDDALRLSGSLTLFWKVRGAFIEGREWLGRAVELSHEAPTPARAKALWGLGLLSIMLGNTDAATPVLERCLVLFEQLGDARGRARALMCLGVCLLYQPSPSSAFRTFETSADLAREVGDPWALANAVGMAGWAHLHAGQPAAARPLLEEAVTVARGAGDAHCLGIGLIGLGEVALMEGHYAAAHEVLSEALVVSRTLRDSYNTASALTLLGKVATERSDLHDARNLLESALAVARETSSPNVVAEALCALGNVEVADGRMSLAQEHYGEANDVMRASGSRSGTPLLGLGEIALAAGNWRSSWQLFHQVATIATAKGNRVGMASALFGLGEAARGADDLSAAVALHLQALRLHCETPNRRGVARSLEALAVIAAIEAHAEHAAQLLGAAAALRQPDDDPLSSADQARRSTALQALQAVLGDEELRLALDAGARMTSEEAIAHATDFRGGRALLSFS